MAKGFANSDGGSTMKGNGTAGGNKSSSKLGPTPTGGKRNAGDGGMPGTIVSGGVNLGTFHGKHHVDHPITGGSNQQKIGKEYK